MTVEEIKYNIYTLDSRLKFLKIQVNSIYGTHHVENTYDYIDEIKNEKRQLIRLLKLKKLKQCMS